MMRPTPGPTVAHKEDLAHQILLNLTGMRRHPPSAEAIGAPAGKCTLLLLAASYGCRVPGCSTPMNAPAPRTGEQHGVDGKEQPTALEGDIWAVQR